jgi:hypothetical protein
MPILESDRVLLRVNGIVEKVLNRSEIKRVVEKRRLGLTIISPDIDNQFLAPSRLSGYTELRKRLATWVPIERRSPMPLDMYFGFGPALMLYGTILVVRSPYIFFPLAAYAIVRLAKFTVIHFKSWKSSNDPIYVKLLGPLPLGLVLLKFYVVAQGIVH